MSFFCFFSEDGGAVDAAGGDGALTQLLSDAPRRHRHGNRPLGVVQDSRRGGAVPQHRPGGSGLKTDPQYTPPAPVHDAPTFTTFRTWMGLKPICNHSDMHNYWYQYNYSLPIYFAFHSVIPIFGAL